MAHWAGQPHADSASSSSPSVIAHTKHLVPHSLTCAVLKRFSSIKCDPGMESVIRMCLDAMALQLLEQQAGETVWESSQFCVMQFWHASASKEGLRNGWNQLEATKILSCTNTICWVFSHYLLRVLE